MIKIASWIIPQMRETRSSEAVRKPQRTSFIHWVALMTAMVSAGSTANSAPAIIDIAIVEVVGRPGHQGFFPIQGEPIGGSTAIVRARLASAANGVGLNTRSPTGTLIGQVAMISPPADSLWPPGTYFAEFLVPTVPFALSVSGTDAAGNNFEISPAGAGAISPQTLAVRLIPTIAEPPSGTPLFVTVQATNYGAPDTFAVSLTSDAGASIMPASIPLSLGANETGGTQFQLTLPANLSGTFTVTLTATAASAATGGGTNEALLELPVAMQPADVLSAWTRPNERRDLIHLDRNSLINIWVCDTGVNGNSVNIANALAPVQVQYIPVAPQDRNACAAPSAFELTFNASDLISALTATGLLSQKNRQIQVPLTGFRPNGTPLIGYVALLF